MIASCNIYKKKRKKGGKGKKKNKYYRCSIYLGELIVN